MKVETLVNDLMRRQQAGENLPEFEECVKQDGRMDYTLMMARLLVEPEKVKEFNGVYNPQTQQLSYAVPSEEMSQDLKNARTTAWAVIICALGPDVIHSVCQKVGRTAEDQEFLRKNYWRYLHYLDPVPGHEPPTVQ